MIFISSKLFAKALLNSARMYRWLREIRLSVIPSTSCPDLMGTNSRVTITHSPANKQLRICFNGPQNQQWFLNFKRFLHAIRLGKMVAIAQTHKCAIIMRELKGTDVLGRTLDIIKSSSLFYG